MAGRSRRAPLPRSPPRPARCSRHETASSKRTAAWLRRRWRRRRCPHPATGPRTRPRPGGPQCPRRAPQRARRGPTWVSTSSPQWWPNVSLICLNRSRSSSSSPVLVPLQASTRSGCPSRSASSVRFGSPGNKTGTNPGAPSHPGRPRRIAFVLVAASRVPDTAAHDGVPRSNR